MAHKVVVPCNEYGIEPKNVMRMMAVQKKDEDGNIIAPLNGLRLVLAANVTNKHTNYAGLKTDSIEDCLNFAATMTKSGLNFKGDLSDCYHLFPLKPEPRMEQIRSNRHRRLGSNILANKRVLSKIHGRCVRCNSWYG